MTGMIVCIAVHIAHPHNNVTIKRRHQISHAPSRHQIPQASIFLKITFDFPHGKNHPHTSKDIYQDREISFRQHLKGLKYSSSGMWCYHSRLRFLR